MTAAVFGLLSGFALHAPVVVITCDISVKPLAEEQTKEGPREKPILGRKSQVHPWRVCRSPAPALARAFWVCMNKLAGFRTPGPCAVLLSILTTSPSAALFTPSSPSPVGL